MNRLDEKYGANKVILGVLILGVAMLCVWVLMDRTPVAQAAISEGRAAIQSREQELREITTAFRGYVDIYINVEGGQPFLSDVQVKGIERASGATFIRFQHRNGENWCVDTDRIVAYRIRRK